jgi:Icc-related predicted phosphoesterase
MASFRFVLASDFHFGNRPYLRNEVVRVWAGHPIAQYRNGVPVYQRVFGYDQSTHNPAVVKEFAKWAGHTDKFDAVILTGDMAASGAVENDVLAARRFIDNAPRPGRLGRPDAWTLRGAYLAGKIVLLPGNHDRYSAARGGAGGRIFDRHFGPAPGLALWNAGPRGVQHWGFSHDAVDLHVIGADFTIEYEGIALRHVPLSVMGQGHVNPATLRLLRNRTEAARQASSRRQKKAIVMWIVHFAPVDGAGVTPALRLLNADDLQNAAREAGVHLLLHGHIHEKADMQTIGAIPVISVGATGCTDNINGFWGHVLDLFADETTNELQFEVTDARFDYMGAISVPDPPRSGRCPDLLA